MTVYIVGAGPGDPGLLTVRAAELLAAADVVVHDRLVDVRVLARARPGARLVDVGKSPGDGAEPQDGIDALLVELGRAGGTVVRLKGGDPYVFGRGGEEALALAGAGVAYEVVPGVTAAVAVPACAGVPVTTRGVASGFAVVTGHDAASADASVDWELLARSGCTVVVLMGVAARAEIARRLVAAGRDPSTPVVAVERGATPEQRTVRTTLGALGATPVESPATIVVGEVAALGLSSYEQRPLAGWRVLVTRAADQGAALADRLASLGARPVELPVIEIVDPADGGAALREAATRAGAFEWVVVASSNAADRLLDAVRDARSLAGTKVAAIGPATAAALARRGIVADLVPSRYLGEALAAEFPPPPGRGARVLLARASVSRDVVPDALRDAGWEVEVVDAYETRPVELSPERLDAVRGAHAVTFASPSAVSAFLATAGRDRVPGVVVTIGPVTSAAVREAGVEVTAEAAEHTAEGIVTALVSHAATVAG
ncbi:MAG: uroporphyrinogen-III C-methyltransferase [Actinomycetota bacterium]|nr:uroporphyrinogen-III C-methyltransferase [Actinomycetota bacterium]